MRVESPSRRAARPARLKLSAVAFARGRPEWAGYSIHVVNERVDAGDVVLRRQVIAGEPSFQQYLRRLRREASDGFVEIIDRLLQGAPLPREPQSGGARYCPPAGLVTRVRAHLGYHGLRRAGRRPLTGC